MFFRIFVNYMDMKCI